MCLIRHCTNTNADKCPSFCHGIDGGSHYARNVTTMYSLYK